MTATPDLLRAGVLGWPIDHSLSPHMMRIWIETAGIAASYDPIAVEPDDAGETIKSLAKQGYRGFNVTLPHKITALQIADKVSEAAHKIGAANLLIFENGRIQADNTDADGFIRGLQDDAIDVKAGKALVLGAGGAARAVVFGLMKNGVTEICLCNRTRERAEALRGSMAPSIRVVDWSERDEALGDASLIVNTTSMGLKGENDLDMDWPRAAIGAAAVDIVYAPLQTGFLRGAAAHGLKTQNGLAMLVGQARPSFAAFFGQETPDGVDMTDRLAGILEGRP